MKTTVNGQTVRGVIGSTGIKPAGKAHVEVGQTYMHRQSCEYRIVKAVEASTVSFDAGAPMPRWIFESLVADGMYMLQATGLRPYAVTMVEDDGAPGEATLTYWQTSAEEAITAANRAWAGMRHATAAHAP